MFLDSTDSERPLERSECHAVATLTATRWRSDGARHVRRTASAESPFSPNRASADVNHTDRWNPFGTCDGWNIKVLTHRRRAAIGHTALGSVREWSLNGMAISYLAAVASTRSSASISATSSLHCLGSEQYLWPSSPQAFVRRDKSSSRLLPTKILNLSPVWPFSPWNQL